MKNTQPTTRREFIKTTAAGAAGVLLAPAISARALGANDRIRVAVMGVIRHAMRERKNTGS